MVELFVGAFALSADLDILAIDSRTASEVAKLGRKRNLERPTILRLDASVEG